MSVIEAITLKMPGTREAERRYDIIYRRNLRSLPTLGVSAVVQPSSQASLCFQTGHDEVSSMANTIQRKEIGGEGVHVRDCYVWMEISYLDSPSDHREYIPQIGTAIPTMIVR